ncbi:hypothetical protein VR010_05890 [Actinomycetaceae bacterium L2_0104]
MSDDRTLTATLEMTDDEGLAAQGATCADIENGLEGTFPYAEEFTVEDIGDGTRLSCRFNVTFDSTFQSMAVTDNGDSITIDIPEEFWTSFNDSAEIEQFGTIDSTFVLEFPGEVTEASDGSTIEGNRATWTSYDSILQGVSATGQASAVTTPSPSPSTPSPTPSTTPASDPTTTPTAPTESTSPNAESESDTGAPLWAWILIGAGVVAAIVAIVLLFANKRRKSGPGGPPAPGGPHQNNPFGGPTNPGQGGQPYAQPQQYSQPGHPAQQFGSPSPGEQNPQQYGNSPEMPNNQDPNPSQR